MSLTNTCKHAQLSTLLSMLFLEAHITRADTIHAHHWRTMKCNAAERSQSVTQIQLATSVAKSNIKPKQAALPAISRVDLYVTSCSPHSRCQSSFLWLPASAQDLHAALWRIAQWVPAHVTRPETQPKTTCNFRKVFPCMLLSMLQKSSMICICFVHSCKPYMLSWLAGLRRGGS